LEQLKEIIDDEEKQPKMKGRFRSKWRKVRRFLIKNIPVQYQTLSSIQTTTHFNTNVLLRQRGC